mgnify:CR=1 FL=1
MAKVEYAFPVDKIHGRVSKKHKVGFAHRKQSAKNYTVIYGVRSTQPSEKEVAHRQKFAAVSAATQTRLKDANKITADQMAFREQTKYKTLYQYVWHQEWETYQA